MRTWADWANGFEAGARFGPLPLFLGFEPSACGFTQPATYNPHFAARECVVL